MSPGRPTDYNAEIAEIICDRLIAGDSLRRICLDDGMPHPVTVMRWLNKHESFRIQYAQAREMQADLEFDSIEELAATATPEDVQVVKLRVDTRKWALGRKASKKYGDRMALAGDSDAPLNVIIKGKDSEL